MQAELAPAATAATDDAAEVARPSVARRELDRQDLAVREPAKKEGASPLRLFQADTFERAARRPLVALG